MNRYVFSERNMFLFTQCPYGLSSRVSHKIINSLIPDPFSPMHHLTPRLIEVRPEFIVWCLRGFWSRMIRESNQLLKTTCGRLTSCVLSSLCHILALLGVGGSILGNNNVLNSQNNADENLFNTYTSNMCVCVYTTWTLTKRLEKKLDGNYTRMLRAIFNKSWWPHPTRHQIYGNLPPITKTIQVRRTKHVGHCWRSKDGLISDVLL